jgi:hypothetical protein
MKAARWLALVLALALVGAACGRDDDDGDASGNSTTTSTSSAGGAAAAGDFGDLPNVCQDGDASGATATGVTDDSIRVATFADPGFTGRPGLNQEFFDVAKVFAAWCNAAGGINGREIVVDERDAALTNYKPRILESCEQDFFMVGGGAVFDDTGVEDRLKCLLPDIAGFVVTAEARGADLVVQPVPNNIDRAIIGEFHWLEEEFPDTVDHVGILTGALPTTIAQAKQYEEVAESLDWEIVYDDQYPPAGVTDWSPYVQGLRDRDVEGLIWVGEPENLAKLVVAMNNIGYTPKFIRTDANHYDVKLIDNGGAALKDNIFIRSVFVPFEGAKAGSATKQYLDAFAQYLPDGKNRTYLGLQAWSAWLLFAQAAKACGNNVTRKCVYDNAKKVAEWTGGGLHAQTNPNAGTAPTCFTIEVATPNGFELADVNPNDGIFHCDDNGLYKLKKDYGKGVTLEDVGLTQADLK